MGQKENSNSTKGCSLAKHLYGDDETKKYKITAGQTAFSYGVIINQPNTKI